MSSAASLVGALRTISIFRVLRRLTWVYTVCHCPFYGALGKRCLINRLCSSRCYRTLKLDSIKWTVSLCEFKCLPNLLCIQNETICATTWEKGDYVIWEQLLTHSFIRVDLCIFTSNILPVSILIKSIGPLSARQESCRADNGPI